MKIRRYPLFVVVLIVLSNLVGCTRSRAIGVVAQAASHDRSITGENIKADTVADDVIAGDTMDRDSGAFFAQSITTITSAATPESALGDRPSSAQTTSSIQNGVSVASALGLQPLLPPLNRTVNILLLGSDRRPDQGNWRTDVLMLIALDMEEQRAAAISLPRDIYMDVIPGHQSNKINVIDFLGEQDETGTGPEFLASILEEKMGVPFHYYLRFDFEGFKQTVDGLDGVELDIECRVHEYLPEEDINLYLEPGKHRLDGKMALGYVRARNQGGDLERARRQQRVVLAVRNQLFTENQLPHLPALYAALRDSVQTDIGFVDAIRFARFALTLADDDIHGMVIAPPDQVKADWRGNMSVWVADWPLIAERIQTVFERPPLVQTNTISQAGDRTACP